MTIDSWKILGLLSNIYLCKPTKKAIESWKVILSEDGPDFLLGLKESIGEIDSSSEQEIEDVLWEYTRLFIGPYKLPCPPWESAYTSAKRLMMQEAYDEVLSFYKEAGLKIDNPDVMADHIGAELNFLAILLQKMSQEPEKNLYYMDMAKRFLNEHLVRWAPQFTLDMEEATDSKFYEALAQVTRNLIIELENGSFKTSYLSCSHAPF
jgi:TorA maturation chaperone TorD